MGSSSAYQTPMLIPRPSISSVQDISDVLLAGTHSLNEIKHFKCLVRQGCYRYFDLSKSYLEQDAAGHQKLRQYVMQHDVKMCRYSLQWPIDAYAKFWASGALYRLKHAIKRKADKAKAENSRDPFRKGGTSKKARNHERLGKVTVNEVTTRRTWTVTFVGKPPPYAKGSSVREISDEETPAGIPNGTHQYQAYGLPATAPLALPVPGINPRLLLPGPSQLPETQPRTENHTFYTTRHYPSPCSFCGYLPPIPNEIQVELYNLFRDIPHVISSLAANGLVHDRHLATLLAWEKSDRQDFCDRLPRNCFSQLDLVIITNCLVNHPSVRSTESTDPADVQPESATGENGESVPWPNEATKDLLVNSPRILRDLRCTMKLDNNNALFARIIDLANHYGEVFVKNYKPFDQASFQRLKKAVDLVLEEEPHLRYYEDAWPVRFYLQRQARDWAQGPHHNSVTSPSVTTNSAVTMAIHDEIPEPLKLTTHSYCPIHPPLDLSHVSQAMRGFLKDHAMQELIIPLVSNGVTTEKHLALLRSLDPDQIEALVARADHATKASLNLFQHMLLKVLLRSRPGFGARALESD